MQKVLTPSKVREMLEKASRDLREEERRRKKMGIRRPEEPGLTPEARHFQFKF